MTILPRAATTRGRRFLTLTPGVLLVLGICPPLSVTVMLLAQSRLEVFSMEINKWVLKLTKNGYLNWILNINIRILCLSKGTVLLTNKESCTENLSSVKVFNYCQEIIFKQHAVKKCFILSLYLMFFGFHLHMYVVFYYYYYYRL